MSVASKITKINTDLLSAYNSINIKKGIVPSNKNTENLSGAILSIPPNATSGTITFDTITSVFQVNNLSFRPKQFYIYSPECTKIPLSASTTDYYIGMLESSQDDYDNYDETTDYRPISSFMIQSDGTTLKKVVLISKPKAYGNAITITNNSFYINLSKLNSNVKFYNGIKYTYTLIGE